MNYAEFLSEYNMPVTPKEFAIVMGAIPSGICMLFKNYKQSTTINTAFPEPVDTAIGQICFSGNKDRNKKVRSLFTEDMISISPAISYWNNLFKNLKWKKIWSLQQKYFLTNKVKEVSFKILNKFYPVNYFMIKYKNNIETRCSFCQVHPETVFHLFWTCSYAEHLWKDVETFIKNNIQQDISVTFKDIIFGHFDSDSNNNKSCFVINLIYFLGKFYIHKCKFTNNKPIFLVFRKEFKMYLNTISSSVNKKARKTTSICNDFNLYTLLEI